LTSARFVLGARVCARDVVARCGAAETYKRHGGGETPWQ
jgi:hypothetical protein